MSSEYVLDKKKTHRHKEPESWIKKKRTMPPKKETKDMIEIYKALSPVGREAIILAAHALKKKQTSAPKLMKAIGIKRKRRLSPYDMFSKKEREIMKKKQPGISFGAMGKQLGKKWKGMNTVDKEPYIRESQICSNQGAIDIVKHDYENESVKLLAILSKHNHAFFDSIPDKFCLTAENVKAVENGESFCVLEPRTYNKTSVLDKTHKAIIDKQFTTNGACATTGSGTWFICNRQFLAYLKREEKKTRRALDGH